MRLMAVVVSVCMALSASAQKYTDGIVDKTIAVIGNEVITISQLEEEVKMMRAYGMMSDKSGRCDILEQMMASKLFLMQARVDSIAVNNDMVEGELRNRVKRVVDLHISKCISICCERQYGNGVNTRLFSL